MRSMSVLALQFSVWAAVEVPLRLGARKIFAPSVKADLRDGPSPTACSACPGLSVKHHPEQRVLQCLNSQSIQCLLLSHHSLWTVEAHQDRCHLEAAQMSLLRIRPLAPKLRRAFASAAQSAEVAPTTRTQHIGVSGRVYHFEELLQERDEVGGVWSAK